MKKKVLIAVCALALVVVVAVGGTLAWLTSQTESVVNTFTYGDIDIELTETTGNTYKMVPGNTITKDPKVTVKADSEDCYLFVKVEESTNFDDFMTYSIAEGWTALENNDGVYYREVNNITANQEFGVIKDNEVKVSNEVTKTMLNNLGENYPTLTFTAYAVQKSNITDATTAWAKFSTDN